MRDQVRAELLKQRSTGAGLGLLAAMLGLVLLVVILHGFGLAAEDLARISEQRTMVFGRGQIMVVLFAALLGALSITSEIRHGTIRPTFLVSPSRGRVVAAKVLVSTLIGAGFGLAGAALGVVLGTVALQVRGIDILISGGDYALLIAGSTAAGALWAAIGVGVGAVVRNQVPTLIGISAWLLFVEGVLLGDFAGIGDAGKFAPGAAATAITGQDPDTFIAPWAGLVLLILYAAAVTRAGVLATVRRDVP